ncbi:uncharacterized protein LOC141900589 isoform X2 [Tubulanus polymorphus]|uniref:uncharacterized protein LOC141900589 isoform X2 n=1 Tax=Tubulanus polymorphus TaxID=672921 RepID=UPI003DA5651F
MGPPDDYIETVLTCEGDYYDPDFPSRLEAFKQNLQGLLLKDEQPLILKKVEPWNSVRVTVNIPKEAALRLKQLAETRDPSLRDIGILAVQIEGDNVISLTLAGKNNETTELVFRTCDGPSPGVSMGYHGSAMPAVGPASSNVNAGRDILNMLGQQVQRSCSTTGTFDSVVHPQAAGMAAFKLPNVVASNMEAFPIPAAIRGQTAMAGHSSNVMSNAISPQKNPIGYPSLSSSSASHVQSFPAPALSRNAGKPKGQIPKLPHFPVNPQGPFQSLQPPPPYPGGTAVNNVPHSMMLNKGAIPTSSQLLVTLLQNEMAAAGTSSNAGATVGAGGIGHVNNFQLKKTPLTSPVKERAKEKEIEAESSPQPKRRRKNKPKDGTKPVARNVMKVDSATRDKFIAHMDDIFSDVIGDPCTGPSDSEDVPSSSVPTPSTTAASPQNIPLPSASAVNTVMESNLPGFEPKTNAADALAGGGGTSAGGVVVTVDKVQSSIPSGSDNRNGPERQSVLREKREMILPTAESLERMIINPYTGQLEPIDSIEDGTIVRQDDDKFDHHRNAERSNVVASNTSTSTTTTTTLTTPTKAAAMNDVKITAGTGGNLQQKLCHNPTPCLTAAEARHVPPFSSIANIVHTSLSSSSSESMISPSVIKTDVIAVSSSSLPSISSASYQVVGPPVSSSHSPPTSSSSASSRAAFVVGHRALIDNGRSASVAASDNVSNNSEQRTSVSDVAVPVTETGYTTPRVGALVVSSSEDNNDSRNSPVAAPSMTSNVAKCVASDTLKSANVQLSKPLSPTTTTRVKSPASFVVNHDSNSTVVVSNDATPPVRRNSLGSSSSSSSLSSSYATSAYSSTTCDSVSNTPQQIVTVGCVLNQQQQQQPPRPIGVAAAAHSSALFVPNKLSKHGLHTVSDNTASCRIVSTLTTAAASSSSPAVTIASSSDYATVNVPNSDTDSKLSSSSSVVAYFNSVADSKNVTKMTMAELGGGLIGGGPSAVVATATMTVATAATTAALSASVMPRDSFPVDAASAAAVSSSGCTTGCDTQSSAFASTRGPHMAQLPPVMGIKTETENLVDLPAIPPAITAKLQPGPLLTRPELGNAAKINKESRIVDGHKKLVSGLDTVMTHIGHVQSDTPSPMLQRPIMSTSVSTVQSAARAGDTTTARNDSSSNSSNIKPQDTRHGSNSSSSSRCVVDSVNQSIGASSAGLDANSSSSPLSSKLVANAVDVATIPVQNCVDSHVAAAEAQSEIKSSSSHVVSRREELVVARSTTAGTSITTAMTEPGKVANLANVVAAEKSAGQQQQQQHQHKKGISIMKPMLDRDAEIADEIKHLPLISDLPNKGGNVLKTDLKVNSTAAAVINTIVCHKTTLSKNVLNTDKMLEPSAGDQLPPTVTTTKNKVAIGTAMDALTAPLLQLNTLTKAVSSKDSSESGGSSSGTTSTSPGRSVSPRNSNVHNPSRTMHDISFYNSSLHPITAPIFPFNLTQSVKKVVGPIPSSDTTKPAKLKMAGTSPPRSASPRGSKVSLHNVSHIESLAKSSSQSHNAASSVAAVNLSAARNDVHGFMSTVSSMRAADGGMFHHGPPPSGKASQRRGSSPKALGSTGGGAGGNQPLTLPPLTNLTGGGVPGLHMLTPQLNHPRTCANNSVPFHSANFHHNMSSLRPAAMMNPNVMNHDSNKNRNHPSAVVSSSSAVDSSYAKFIANVSGSSSSALNLSAKTMPSRSKQSTSPRRLSPVVAASRSSPSIGQTTISSLSQSPIFTDYASMIPSSKSTAVESPIAAPVVATEISALKANLPAMQVVNEPFSSAPAVVAKEKENGENPHVPEVESLAKTIPVGLMMDHAYVQRANSTSSRDVVDNSPRLNDLKSSSSHHQHHHRPSTTIETPKDDSNGSSTTSEAPPHSSNNNTLGHALNLVKTEPVKSEYDNLNAADAVSDVKITAAKLGEEIVAIHPAKIARHNSADRTSEDNNSDVSDLSESTRSLRGRAAASDRPDSPVVRAGIARSARAGSRRKTPVDDLDAKSDRSESPKLTARGAKRKNHDDADSLMNPIDLKRSKLDANCLIPSDSLNCLDSSADDAEVSEMTSRKPRNIRAKSVLKAGAVDDKALLLHNTRFNDGKGGRQSRSSSRGASSECGEDHAAVALDVPVHGHDTRSRTRTSSRKASDECSSDGGKRADESRSRRNTSSRSRSPVHGKERSPPRVIRDKSPVRGSSRVLPLKVSPPKKDPSPARDVPARRTTRSCKPKELREKY